MNSQDIDNNTSSTLDHQSSFGKARNIFVFSKEKLSFTRIGDRVLVLVGLVILVGLFGLSAFHTQRQEAAILAQNERAMDMLMQTVNEGLKAIMLTGNAGIAQEFSKHLQNIEAISEFKILRVDGTEAFKDNKTIAIINQRLGNEEFMPRQTETVVPILAADDVNLQRVLKTKQDILVYETDPNNGQRRLTFLAPVRKLKECQRCHGSDMEIRGVVRLVTSMDRAEEDIQKTRNAGYYILFMMTGLVLVVTAVLVQRSIARPVAQITAAMRDIAEGNVARHIAVTSRDELGVMARRFNWMSDQLFSMHNGLKQERDKLTTILLSSQEGIVVTDGQERVVLVNPTMERLLGKSQEQIVREGLLRIIDDPEYLTALLDPTKKGVPTTVVYNNHILNVHAATIFSSDNTPVGSAALIRDITQEKKLEDKLRKLSNTDALTGLYNRRWFDTTLAEELQRTKRYNQTLSLLLLDVDHFKRFNDTHGHDQGDRVLRALGKIMQEHFREVDHPCRYGGEEFCAILPNTGFPGANLAAERLRQKVETIPVDGLHVTISIGAAVYPLAGSTADDLFKQADLALYQAKKTGRNRVCFAEGSMPTKSPSD